MGKLACLLATVSMLGGCGVLGPRQVFVTHIPLSHPSERAETVETANYSALPRWERTPPPTLRRVGDPETTAGSFAPQEAPEDLDDFKDWLATRRKFGLLVHEAHVAWMSQLDHQAEHALASVCDGCLESHVAGKGIIRQPESQSRRLPLSGSQ
jgi:hypothetical protein